MYLVIKKSSFKNNPFPPPPMYRSTQGYSQTKSETVYGMSAQTRFKQNKKSNNNDFFVVIFL